MPEDKDAERPLVDDLEDKIEIEFVDVDDQEPARYPVPVEAVAAQPADEDEAQRLKAEVEHLREMYLRKLAEFDNYRKRVERERREMRKTAAEGLVSELLRCSTTSSAPSSMPRRASRRPSARAWP
jgi:molecular chaperone GrpE